MLDIDKNGFIDMNSLYNNRLPSNRLRKQLNAQATRALLLSLLAVFLIPVSAMATGNNSGGSDNSGSNTGASDCSAVDSGINGALQHLSFNINSDNPHQIGGVHTLNSITISNSGSDLLNGTYDDLIVPDSYVSDFSHLWNNRVREAKGSNFLGDLNVDGAVVYDSNILDAFQSLELSHFQQLDSKDFRHDSYTLAYNTPVTSTAGGFIAITERGGNNDTVVNAFDINSNLLGSVTARRHHDYIDTHHQANNSSQNIEVALFPIDDLAPAGSAISYVQVSFGSNSNGDGPDGKVFFYTDLENNQSNCNNNVDTDGDNIPDALDLDDDNDGISDIDEALFAAPSTAQVDAGYFTDGNRQLVFVSNNTNAQGFSESGWNELVSSRGGSISSDSNFSSTTFSNGSVSISDDGDNVTATVAASSEHDRRSGNSGSTLRINPGNADHEPDNKLQTTVVIDLNQAVYAFGFDLVDIFDNGDAAPHISDIDLQYDIFLDGELAYRLFGNTVGGNGTGSIYVEDADGNLIDAIVVGHTRETFIGFTSSDPVSEISLILNSQHNSGGSSADVFGLDELKWSTDNIFDTDGDGIPNSKDLDSDNDGISDLYESGANEAALDEDNDGVIDDDEFTDNGALPNSVANNGIADIIESTVGTVNTGTSPRNTDVSDEADFINLDSDNDNLPDAVEAQATVGYISPDVTGNDTRQGVNLTGLFLPINSDSDSLPDYIDTNSDNESTDDSIESGFSASGVSYANPDGNLNNPATQLANTQVPSTIEVDYREGPDSDGDGVSDADEISSGTNPNNPCDFPGNTSTDSDNDGLSNCEETTGNDDPNTSATPNGMTNQNNECDPFMVAGSCDPDGDGVPNSVDNNNGSATAANDTFAASFGSVTTFNILANDDFLNNLDSNNAPTTSLSTVVGANTTAAGTISYNADTGEISYSPLASEAGSSVSVEYQVCNNSSGSDVCSTAIATINVSSCPSPLDSDNDGLTNCEETTGIDDPSTNQNPNGNTSDANDECDPFKTAGSCDPDGDGTPNSADDNDNVATAESDFLNAAVGVPATLNVLANDDFLPNDNQVANSAGTTSIARLPAPNAGTAQGSISFNSTTGELEYTPTEDEAGAQVTIGYEVCNDATGQNVCATAIVTVDVAANPDADQDGNPDAQDPNPLTPTANDDNLVASPSVAAVFDILANDDFLDNNDPNNLGVTTITNTGNGTAINGVFFNLSTGEISYTPDPSEAGSTVTIEYEVCNSETAVCDTALVSIEVIDPNTCPNALDSDNDGLTNCEEVTGTDDPSTPLVPPAGGPFDPNSECDPFMTGSSCDPDQDGSPNLIDPNNDTVVAGDDLAIAAPTGTTVINILANDDFLDNENPNNLGTTTITDTGNGTAIGVAVFSPNTGELSYTPDPSEVGSTVTIEYEVCNSDTTTCAIATVTINVLDDANCPAPNDTDNDGLTDCEETTAVDDPSTPGIPLAGGSDLNDECDPFNTGPNCDLDGDGSPNSEDPNIAAPTANVDSAIISDTGASIIDILSNDDFLANQSTVNLGTTTLTNLGTGSAAGSVLLDPATGELSYTPLPNEAGSTVTVDYEVCNSQTNVCDTATVTLEVLAAAACPNSTDSDGDGLTDCEETTGTDDPTTVAIPPSTDSNPNDICDPLNAAGICDSDGDGVPNNVDPNDSTPTASNDTATAAASGPTVIDILLNDDFLPNNDPANLGTTDVDNTGNGTAGGTINFDPITGALTYTPLPIEQGTTVTVEYEVCNDLTGACAIAIATIDVLSAAACPNAADSDGDGLTDCEELTGVDDPLTPDAPPAAGSDPNDECDPSTAGPSCDTDGDGSPNSEDINDATPTANDDMFAAVLGSATRSNILANDDFLANDNASNLGNTTLTEIGGSAGGTVEFDTATGEIAYIPLASEADSTVTVEYEVCNSLTSVCATATVSIDVAGLACPNATDTDGDGLSDCEEVNGLDDPNTPLVPVVPSDPNNACDPDASSLACDTDRDGIPDITEGTGDTDGDGLPDFNDPDSDNDGIPDSVEAGIDPLMPVDTDGDSIPDYRDLDSDADGIIDSYEAGFNPTNPVDTDGDGKPDWIDTDSDNDRIPDVLENTNGQLLTGMDADGDGVDDGVDPDQTGGTDAPPQNGLDDAREPANQDTDNLPNHLDLDSDNDGLLDTLESQIPALSGADNDGDGIDNTLDVDFTGGDDLNNNGIDDAIEPIDTDSDGKANYLDLDSDNDSIPDAVEAAPNDVSLPTLSGNDTDNDGIDDAVDPDNGGNVDNNGNGISDDGEPQDTDSDNVADYIDLDSDNDSLLDLSEAANNPAVTDSNMDGLVDSPSDEASTQNPIDSDNDTVPDYRDIESTNPSNDGTGPFDLDNNPNPPVDAGPQDGIVDDANDPDGDGVTGDADPEPNSFGSNIDSDGDLIPDGMDLDDDNDGIPDAAECDAVSGNGAVCDTPVDTDGDGIFDHLDLDSDNDGLFDLIEATNPSLTDADNNGIIDQSLADPANDANMDGLYDPISPALVPVDTDGDNVADFRDIDSDNDDESDLSESIADPVILALLDANNDGIMDAINPTTGIAIVTLTSLDLNNDGIADFRFAFSSGSSGNGLRTAVSGGGGSTGLSSIIMLVAVLVVKRMRFIATIALMASLSISAVSNAGRSQTDCAFFNGDDFNRCFYIGAGINYSHIHPEGRDDQGWATDNGEDNDTGWEVLIGYRFREHWFAEFKYADQGEAGMETSNAALDQQYPDANIYYRTYSLMAGRYFGGSDNAWHPYLKAGLAQITNDAEDDGNTIDFREVTNQQFAFGGGIEYRHDKSRWFTRLNGDFYDQDSAAVSLSINRYLGGSNKRRTPELVESVSAPVTPAPPVEKPAAVSPVPVVPSPAMPSSAVCDKFNGVIEGINFKTDSAELLANSRVKLQGYASSLLRHPNTRVLVSAHTDWVGSTAYNQDLSQRRAASVVSYLIQQGVSPSQLVSQGHGELKPIADNNTRAGRAMNRRVELDVISNDC